jgi:hypothetical protein
MQFSLSFEWHCTVSCVLLHRSPLVTVKPSRSSLHFTHARLGICVAERILFSQLDLHYLLNLVPLSYLDGWFPDPKGTDSRLHGLAAGVVQQ